MSTAFDDRQKELLNDMGFHNAYEYNDLPGWVTDLMDNLIESGWRKL